MLTLFTPRFGDQYNRSSSKTTRKLSPRRRALAFIVVASGLVSFFLPLVTTDPAVMGQTRWSAWHISCAIYEGSVLPKHEDLFSFPEMAATIYVLLFFALGALSFSCSKQVLTTISAIGCFSGWLWRGDRISFEEMFYGNFSYQNFSLVRRVEFGTLTILLLCVMGALLLITLSGNTDEGSAA